MGREREGETEAQNNEKNKEGVGVGDTEGPGTRLRQETSLITEVKTIQYSQGSG